MSVWIARVPVCTIRGRWESSRRGLVRMPTVWTTFELAVGHEPVRYDDLIVNRQPRAVPPTPPHARGHPPASIGLLPTVRGGPLTSPPPVKWIPPTPETRARPGLGPKTLQRIFRLQRFLTAAERHGSMVGLAELAARAGYADQAHLSHDVRAFAGLPPAALLRERTRTADS
jgi:hypothetical protein